MNRLFIFVVVALMGLQAHAVGPEKVERYAPDAMKSLFVSKGTYMGGMSVSYQENNTDNMNITVLKNLDGQGFSFGVSPHIGYFFKDNQAVGLRFNYNRSKVDLRSLDLSLGEDFNISLDHIFYQANTYEVSGYWRVYMPIAKSKIFAVYNETRLGYRYSESKNSTGTGTEYTGSYTTGNRIFAGLAPGVTAFITNNAAIEVGADLVGFEFGKSEQVTNQVSQGSTSTAAARFKINLLSLHVGMALYF